MSIKFTKYHGCGNDFIITDYKQIRDMDKIKLADFIKKVCDRHMGVGADGLIAVKTNPYEMIYYNSDSTPAAMCGNGIRCFSKYLTDNSLVTNECFDVVTKAGIKKIRILSLEPFEAEVAMGKPDFAPSSIGVEAKEPILNKDIETPYGVFRISSLLMSAVHTVIFTDSSSLKLARTAGEAICENEMFADKTNVNFVNVISRDKISVSTFERGAGVTLACGTGACASAVIARKFGLIEDKVTALLPGGVLNLSVGEDYEVMMSGPARLIAKGEYYYD